MSVLSQEVRQQLLSAASMADLDSAVVRMMCAGELDGEALELVSGAKEGDVQ